MAERWPAAMLLRTAAEYMDCSPDQVEKLIKDGHLSAVQYYERGDRRILREEIDSYLEQRRKKKVTA